MKISYERQVNRSYMILEDVFEKTAIEEKMLRENEIRILLPFYTLSVDGNERFVYEITGKRSLRDRVMAEGLPADFFGRLVRMIGILFEEMERYLILPSHLYLSPDTIFLSRDGDDFTLKACYFPLSTDSTKAQLQGLFEFFLAEIGHEDPMLPKVCFSMYECLGKPDFSYEMLLTLLSELPGEEPPQQEEIYVERVLPLKSTVTAPMTSMTEQGGFDAAPSEVGYFADEEDFSGEEESDLFQILRQFFAGLFQKREAEDDVAEVPKKKRHIKEAQAEDSPEKASRRKERRAEEASARQEKKGKKKRKAAVRLFPEQADELLFVDPTDTISEPTVLLSAAGQHCAGRLLYEGAGDEADFEITGESFRIGSKRSDNDAVLHSTGVSRHHARITREEESFFIEDLNSTNGTYVNDELLPYRERYELHSADRIRFADVPYRIV